MSAKPSQMEPFRLAKKLTKIWYRTGEASAPERKVLRALGDIWSMRDLECRKSLQTIREDHDISPRMFQYAMDGRKRGDGSEYYPGLLKRGVVIVKRQPIGRPVVYGPNLPLLRQLCDESGGTEGVSEPTHKPTHKPTHTESDNLRTGCVGGTHKSEETYAQGAWEVRTGCVQGTPEVPEGAPREVPQKRETQTPAPASPYRSPEARAGSAENPKPGGQEKPGDRLLEKVLLRAKTLNPRVRFSKTSRDDMRNALARLRDKGINWNDVDFAIQQTIRGCTDDVAFSFFGTTLAANFESDVLAHQTRSKEAARKAAEAKPWHDRIADFVKSDECKSVSNVEAWLAQNPRKAEGVVSLFDFYVDQAISHCWEKPNLDAEYKELRKTPRNPTVTPNQNGIGDGTHV